MTTVNDAEQNSDGVGVANDNIKFHPFSLTLFTEKFHWLSFFVATSQYDQQKAYIFIDGPNTFHETLKSLDQIIKRQVERMYPTKKYSSWINEDGAVRLHVAKNKGILMLNIGFEDNYNNQKKNINTIRAKGLNDINRWIHQQHYFSRLQFDFFYLLEKNGTVSCTPRLQKLVLLDNNDNNKTSTRTTTTGVKVESLI